MLMVDGGGCGGCVGTLGCCVVGSSRTDFARFFQMSENEAF